MPVTPILTNHYGAAVETLEDYREVMDRVDDARCRTVLEVGHFHSAGIGWREAYDALWPSFALVHIKDQVGAQSEAFGQGEVDLPGLFARLIADRWEGDAVVEMENEDTENTAQYLRAAVSYIKAHTEVS